MAKILRFPRRGRRKDSGGKPLFPGLFIGGTDARPANFASDAIASPEHARSITAEAPDAERLRKLRRRRRAISFGLAAMFLLGCFAALFGERGYFDVRRQRSLYVSRKAEVADHQARFQELKREVDSLKSDPHAIERIAREQLGYAEKGEVVLLLPGEAETNDTRLDEPSRSAIVPPESQTP